MRICMLTTGFPRFRGDLFGHFILELAEELVAQGLEVEVVAPHQRGLAVREEMAGVQVRRFRYLVPASWQRVAYGDGIPTNLKTSRLAKVQVPLFLLGFWAAAFGAVRGAEVVHCHWTISGLVGYLATRLWPRPLVLSVRGSDLQLMGGGAMRRLNRWICRGMDRIVAVSEEIGAQLERLGVDRAKVQVVPNGVDARFQPGDQQAARRRLNLPVDRFIALFVGLLVPVKGVEVLLEALRYLDDSRVMVVLVGEGSQREVLQRQADETGLSGQVVFAGQRSAEEVPRWMNAADLLVLPSRSEGRPNVVLEAQACGLPVIATRVGGTPELVRDGENGLLVERDDPQALAQAMARLLGDRSLRMRLGQAGRARVLRGGFTWTACAQRMVGIYRGLLERG